jgi:hypothetical protein
MSMDEYLALIGSLSMDVEASPILEVAPAATKKKRSTKYQREYKKNFQKISKEYQKKDGSWKKNGFRMTVKKSHESTRKGMQRKTARRAYTK